jgi:transcription elongation factor Elf1
MSDELKACPFCGSSNTTLDYYEISGPQELGTIVVCNDCGASAKSIVDWNTRPIEDALLKRAERAEQMVERLTNAGDKMAEDLGATGWDTQSHIEWHALKVTLWNEQNALVTELLSSGKD